MNTPFLRFVVIQSKSKPDKWSRMGPRYNIALVETDGRGPVNKIDPRLKHFKQVVSTRIKERKMEIALVMCVLATISALLKFFGIW